MDRIIFLCRQEQVEEARALAEATKYHIAASCDLSGRPYIVRQIREVTEFIDRAERKRELL